MFNDSDDDNDCNDVCHKHLTTWKHWNSFSGAKSRLDLGFGHFVEHHAFHH